MRSSRSRTDVPQLHAKTRGLAEKNRDLAFLYETTAFLSEPDDVEDLCRGFLQRIKRSMGAQAGAVRLFSDQNDALVMLSHEGLSDRFVTREATLGCGQCLCGSALQQGTSVLADTSQPPPALTLKTCVREGFRTAGAFVISHKDQPVGIFNLYFNEPRQFSRQKVHLLETLGQHLGMSLESQRLRSREKEMAVSEERSLIAQELHDSIAQSLAFLNIQVQLLQESLHKGNVDEALTTAAQIREGVQESYDDVRELLVHFRTRMSHADLDTAILSALEKFETQTGIRTEFDRIGSGVPLSPEDELQVLHIVQESLSNIRKHAQAERVQVKIEHSSAGVIIEVRDDGVGFEPANNPAIASGGHIGLKIMKERALRIGGECLVTSTPGEGTQIALSLMRK